MPTVARAAEPGSGREVSRHGTYPSSAKPTHRRGFGNPGLQSANPATARMQAGICGTLSRRAEGVNWLPGDRVIMTRCLFPPMPGRRPVDSLSLSRCIRPCQFDVRFQRITMLPSAITKVLTSVCARIPAGTCWAVSCGSALALHEVPHRPRDLDLFAPRQDAARIIRVFEEYTCVFPYHWHSSPHIDSYWGRFTAGQIEVDVVGDFSVRQRSGVITWDASHPCWRRLEQVVVAGCAVPCFAPEDLRELYAAIPGEAHKVALLDAILVARAAMKKLPVIHGNC